jgi:hypothetical protein
LEGFIKDSFCAACGAYGTMDKAHIKSVGSGGEHDGTILLCRLDHRIQHNEGWDKFIKRYPHLKEVLSDLGWEIDDVFGIKKLRKI